MIMKLKNISIIAVSSAAMLIPVWVNAETIQSMTWNECQKTALERNPSLKSSRYSVETARYNYNVSRDQALPYPGISASHSFSRSENQNSQSADRYSLDVSASETLFSMKSYSEMKVQSKSLEKANVDLRSSLADTRKNLLNSFINLLYAQERIRVMENILTIREKSAEMINLQYEGGRESNGNRLRTEAILAQAKVDLEQAKRDLVTAQRNLNASLGLDSFSAIIASGALSIPSLVSNIDFDELALYIPSVLSSKKSVEISYLKVKKAESDLFPTLTSNQGLSWIDTTEFPTDRTWSVGLSLTWPLFNNGPTYFFNNRASAKSQYQSAQMDYRNALLTAKSSLQSDLASLETTIDNVRTSGLLLEAARERHSEAEIQYLAGTLNFQNWQDVEQELVSSEQAYLNSLKSSNTARAELDGLLGVPLGD